MCEVLSHFQVLKGHCRKVHEIEISRVCNYLKWKRREFCPNRKVFVNSLKSKLNELVKDNLRLRQDKIAKQRWSESTTAWFYNTNSSICQESCNLESYVGIASLTIPKLSGLFSVGMSISRPRYALTHNVLQSQCRGSKK